MEEETEMHGMEWVGLQDGNAISKHSYGVTILWDHSMTCTIVFQKVSVENSSAMEHEFRGCSTCYRTAAIIYYICAATYACKKTLGVDMKLIIIISLCT